MTFRTGQMLAIIAGLLAFQLLQAVSICQEKLELKVEGASLLVPEMFEFKIPPGQLFSGVGRRLLVEDEISNKKVVAKIHVQVGENFICLMPDGRLKDILAVDATPTQEPFDPASTRDIADQMTAGDFRDFRVKHTARYVYIYNTSEEFVEGTSRVIETMLRGVMNFAKAQRIDIHDPEVPLIVTMFRTEREYQAYRKVPSGIVAYYDFISNQVVLYEESPLAKIDPKLALKQTISTIAHEGAHQILHNIGVQQRLSVWPMWLTEGMAEYYAPTEPGKQLRWKGAGKVNDFRMFELESYYGSKVDLTLDGSTTQRTIQAGKLNSAGYASAWSLVHYLSKRKRRDYYKLVKELSQLQPLQGFVSREPLIEANRVQFERYFGTDWAEIEQDLIDHLKRQDYRSPFANYPHFLAMVIYQDEGAPQKRVNTFLSEDGAGEWYNDFVRGLSTEGRNTAKAVVRRFQNRESASRFSTNWLSQ